MCNVSQVEFHNFSVVHLVGSFIFSIDNNLDDILITFADSKNDQVQFQTCYRNDAKMTDGCQNFCTCQLFWTQSHEIFILEVSGFLKMTRLYSKTSKDARIFPKLFQRILKFSRTCLCSSDFGKLSSFGHFTWTFRFLLWFEFTYF